MSNDQRIIGRWTIGSTLGKGGYSWVKKGKDIKTGKIVALKFMEKADNSWAEEQAVQVETEIDALKSVRHRNIMKLYAYNLNAQYPMTQKNQFLDTILLVLEFAPGGELFDVLYYTKSLDEKIARTYFRQIIDGVEACHNAGVIHRDLKPQNLLFDHNFNIKITDFGLSKVVRTDADSTMKTTYVGTKGYQAPELLRDQPYDLKCDIFSIGVILFILLAGYPPFEQARKSDKWFKPLVKKNYEKFWHAHRKSPIVKSNMTAKTLLEKMLANDPAERASMADIRSHEWFRGEVVPTKQLVPVLKQRHRMAEERRLKDVRKMSDLANSVNPHRAIEGLEKNSSVDFVPFDELGLDIYSWGRWTDIYNGIQEFVPDKTSGEADYDFEEHMLKCKVRAQGDAAAQTPIKFDVKVYKSRVWEGKAPKDAVDDSKTPEQQKQYQDRVYVVKLNLTSGDVSTWNSIRDNILLVQCQCVMKGLPKWALQMQEAANRSIEEQKEPEPEQAQDDAKGVDDYDALLGNDAQIWAKEVNANANVSENQK